MAQPGGEALVLEQLFEIFDATYPARNKWFNLGGVLGLPTSDLKAIKKDGDDAGDCLREMLELRLKKLPPLTWARIVAALRSTVVAEQTLSKRVEDNKCQLGNHGNGTEMDGVPQQESTPHRSPSSVLATRPTMAALQLIKWRGKDGETKRLRVMQDVMPEWKKLGTTLGVPESVLRGFVRQFRDDPEDCFRAVIGRWMDGGLDTRDKYPYTWKGLISALTDCGKTYVALELPQALPNMLS